MLRGQFNMAQGDGALGRISFRLDSLPEMERCADRRMHFYHGATRWQERPPLESSSACH